MLTHTGTRREDQTATDRKHIRVTLLGGASLRSGRDTHFDASVSAEGGGRVEAKRGEESTAGTRHRKSGAVIYSQRTPLVTRGSPVAPALKWENPIQEELV